jgi:transcriptional regulator with XRE-family HTH domain
MSINPRVFWLNVRSIREKKGWSQQQIADKLEMNVKNYNSKERGFAARLPLEQAEKVAEILGTTVEELSKGEAPGEPLVNPEVASFWNNVRVRRERLQLSQKDVADKLGMSAQNYQAKESGKAAKLPADLVEQVAKVLGCTVDELKEMQKEVLDDKLKERECEVNNSGEYIYDISHLPEFVQEYLSNRSNTKSISDFVFRQLMNSK